MGAVLCDLHVLYLMCCILFVNRSKDEHNKEVKKAIESEISLKKENIHSKILIESKCIIIQSVINIP